MWYVESLMGDWLVKMGSEGRERKVSGRVCVKEIGTGRD